MGWKKYKSWNEWDEERVNPGTNGAVWQPPKEWAVMKEIVNERGSQIGVLCYIMPMPGGRLH